jgi:hypothetical protein
MGDILHLDVSNNALQAAGTKVLAEALKQNQIITELNISSNRMTSNCKGESGKDMSGVTTLADAIKDMGALLKLNISSNFIPRTRKENLERTCAAGGIELSSNGLEWLRAAC